MVPATDTLAEEISELVGNQIQLLITDRNQLIQIMEKSVSKEAALKRILNTLSMTSSQCIVFGDGTQSQS
ncbi:HAD hydrolase family protein [Risungbinella massiliensis]|uniref:HAD hydrolase family protein n=1 Tax=Risungbinella massiliensis TaxID=1329796 RepID=UPI0005CB8546